MTYNPILYPERAGAMLGVPGRFFAVTAAENWPAGTFTSQKWTSESRPIDGYGRGAKIRAEARFDDSCRNGHNSFAITADVFIPGRRDFEACGCLHSEVAAVFPELAPLIKWHLTNSDGPTHYVANTVYHAGDRDYNGKREGEPSRTERRIRFGDNPITHKLPDRFTRFLEDAAEHNGRSRFDFEVIRVDHANKRETFGPKFTFGGYGAEWHQCPFDTERDALEFLAALQVCNPQFVTVVTAFSEGKRRELDAARRCAVWPEATDDELSVEPEALKAALLARLPGLIAAFRADMESAGFFWAPDTIPGKAE